MNVIKFNPNSSLSLFCPICFNIVSYIWSFWIKSLWILSFLRYNSFCLLSFSLSLSLTRIDYQPALILHSQCLQHQWSILMPLINSTQPWHHNEIAITTHYLIIFFTTVFIHTMRCWKRNWLRSWRWSWQKLIAISSW